MKREDGITLIALIMTIIIIMILATACISGVILSNKESKSGVAKTELTMVQNAILQRKTQADLTKVDYEDLPGRNISKSEVQQIAKDVNLKGDDGDYKLLDQNSFKELGITNVTDSYIVNYETGEVINKDKFNMYDEQLYVYGVE